MAIKPFWERYLRIGDRPVHIAVEVGLTGYELVMRASDSRDTVRIVLATPSWDFEAEMLKVAIDEGLDALARTKR